jgi:hypothetical protein
MLGGGSERLGEGAVFSSRVSGKMQLGQHAVLPLPRGLVL